MPTTLQVYTNYKKTFVKDLETFMKYHNVSEAGLAYVLQVTTRTVKNWLSGKLPNRDNAFKLVYFSEDDKKFYKSFIYLSGAIPAAERLRETSIVIQKQKRSKKAA